jgi:hypothetical protein
MSMPNRRWLRWLLAPTLALTVGAALANPSAAQEAADEETGTVTFWVAGLAQPIVVDVGGGDATAVVVVSGQGSGEVTASAVAIGGDGGSVVINLAGTVPVGEPGAAGADGADGADAVGVPGGVEE